jgi:hypothetical protein
VGVYAPGYNPAGFLAASSPPPVERCPRVLMPHQSSNGNGCLRSSRAYPGNQCIPSSVGNPVGWAWNAIMSNVHPRWPDYISLNLSLSALILFPGLQLIPPIFQVSGNLTITRKGQVFGGLGAGVGILGWQGAVRAGWINQSKPASASQANNFVAGSSVTGDTFFPEYGIPEVLELAPA